MSWKKARLEQVVRDGEDEFKRHVTYAENARLLTLAAKALIEKSNVEIPRVSISPIFNELRIYSALGELVHEVASLCEKGLGKDAFTLRRSF